jgi:hypothetical protein
LIVNVLSEKDDMDIHPLDFANEDMSVAIDKAKRFRSYYQRSIAYHKEIYQMDPQNTEIAKKL